MLTICQVLYLALSYPVSHLILIKLIKIDINIFILDEETEVRFAEVSKGSG